MLQVSELTLSGPAGPLVRGVGFSVAAGERVAVVGASGSGKSLTAKALLGALPPGLTATGGIRIGGVEVRDVTCDRRAAGQRLGFVPQDTSLALHPLVTVGEQIALPLRAAGKPQPGGRGTAGESQPGGRETAASRAAGGKAAGWWTAGRKPSGWRAAGERRGQVAALLEAVGLMDAMEIARRYPGELSGGQRQRVCLAIALASRPPLVIADEPTTALDMITQAGIVRLLRERTGKTEQGGGVRPALIFITHDLAVASALCERVIVMDDGAIVEDGGVERVIAGASHPRTRAMVEAARRASKALEGLR